MNVTSMLSICDEKNDCHDRGTNMHKFKDAG